MSVVEEIVRAFDRSLIISCWKFVFPVLVCFYLFIFIYDKRRYGGKRKSADAAPQEVEEKLDGIEYVGGLGFLEILLVEIFEEFYYFFLQRSTRMISTQRRCWRRRITCRLPVQRLLWTVIH